MGESLAFGGEAFQGTRRAGGLGKGRHGPERWGQREGEEGGSCSREVGE